MFGAHTNNNVGRRGGVGVEMRINWIAIKIGSSHKVAFRAYLMLGTVVISDVDLSSFYRYSTRQS